MSTKVDCNVCSGTIRYDGQTLSIGPALACTRAACPTMAFADSYLTLLAGDNGVQGDGTSLTLTSPRGVLRFTR